MSYTLLDPQPAPRDPALAWEEVGPGLYPDELALDLGDGLLVAVDVQARWLENGAGVELIGNARWIDIDGRTHLTDGTHVETTLQPGASPGFVDAFGISTLQRHVLLALIGRPEPLGPWVWSEAALASVDIRQAVARVAQVKPADVGALLGLA